MSLAEDLIARLRSSQQQFVWAFEQVPVERRSLVNPRRPERWTARRILYHLAWYEQHIAIPNLNIWLGFPPPAFHSMEEDALVEEAAWQKSRFPTGAADDPSLIGEFRSARQGLHVVLDQLPPARWNERQAALWGDVTPTWIVLKSLQHTIEHTDELLKMIIWWHDSPHHA